MNRIATNPFTSNALKAARVLIASLTVFAGTPVVAGEPVATITAIRGEADVLPHGRDERHAAKPGMPLHVRDVVDTGALGRIRIQFADGSRLSLGSGSTFRISRFRFDREAGTVDALLNVARGFFRSVTGSLSLRRRTRVRTATATIGIRGTDFMGEATATRTQAFVIDGAVIVSNSDPAVDGNVLLEPGEGTSVVSGQAPRPKGRWPQEKVERFRSLTNIE